jgi:hypothetical protein
METVAATAMVQHANVDQDGVFIFGRFCLSLDLFPTRGNKREDGMAALSCPVLSCTRDTLLLVDLEIPITMPTDGKVANYWLKIILGTCTRFGPAPHRDDDDDDDDDDEGISEHPSMEPSSKPSFGPSNSWPALKPSVMPTAMPTAQPSAVTSGVPSSSVSSPMYVEPSTPPSAMPSSKPSTKSSAESSFQPSSRL